MTESRDRKSDLVKGHALQTKTVKTVLFFRLSADELRFGKSE